MDGSSEIKEAEDGHCDGEEVMCTARDGRFAGKKICVEKKFQCDNFLQCEDGQDEEQCEAEYKKKGTFKKDHHFICRKTYMNISNDTDSGKFYPMRAIRWVSVIIIFSIITITKIMKSIRSVCSTSFKISCKICAYLCNKLST